MGTPFFHDALHVERCGGPAGADARVQKPVVCTEAPVKIDMKGGTHLFGRQDSNMRVEARRSPCGRGNRVSEQRFSAAVVWVLLFLSSVTWAGRTPYEWALIRLDYARQEKVTQLQNFCNRLHALALDAVEDRFVLACFDINRQYAHAAEKGPVPESLVQRVQELRDGFNAYYIQKYFAFYDILFVNRDGRVFYTVRKEDDLCSNLLENQEAPEALKQALRTVPAEEGFVDFRNYGPSSKPAAFFVEPVHRDGDHVGWVILQCAISKINTLLAWTDDLGQTGETFLVNQEGYMLTESNFTGASTILKKRLDDRNVQEKFSDGRGHRMVTDYRGRTALTSFEVVEFLGTQWLVVAKMDVDEVITDHYIQHRRYYADRLLSFLREEPAAPLRPSVKPTVRETLRIDMDEFLWADHEERLHTFGISTCTGLLAAYPGKLAYLAHVSPKDKLYGAPETNLLAPMIKRIKSFDVYRCERYRVTYVVVANHLRTLLPIIDKLVDEGFFLSQVHLLYRPDAESATVSYDYPDDSLIVTWRFPAATPTENMHQLEDASNIGQILRGIMQSENEAVSENELWGARRDGSMGDDHAAAPGRPGQEGGPDMYVTGVDNF
jgi:hypothetical protein